jgi:hypothetical protein
MRHVDIRQIFLRHLKEDNLVRTGGYQQQKTELTCSPRTLLVLSSRSIFGTKDLAGPLFEKHIRTYVGVDFCMRTEVVACLLDGSNAGVGWTSVQRRKRSVKRSVKLVVDYHQGESVGDRPKSSGSSTSPSGSPWRGGEAYSIKWMETNNSQRPTHSSIFQQYYQMINSITLCFMIVMFIHSVHFRSQWQSLLVSQAGPLAVRRLQLRSLKQESNGNIYIPIPWLDEYAPRRLEPKTNRSKQDFQTSEVSPTLPQWHHRYAHSETWTATCQQNQQHWCCTSTKWHWVLTHRYLEDKNKEKISILLHTWVLLLLIQQLLLECDTTDEGSGARALAGGAMNRWWRLGIEASHNTEIASNNNPKWESRLSSLLVLSP